MKTVKGKWKYEDGTPVASGRVFFKLSQDAVAIGDAQIAPQLVSFNLDASGALGSGAGVLLYFNDELSPAQTTYTVSVLAPGGGLVWGAESISISGASPFDISSAIPSTISVLLGNPVLQNPTGQQTINAYDLVMEGASLGLSASGSAVGDVFLNRVSAGVLGIGTSHSGAAGTLKAATILTNSGAPAQSGTVRLGGSENIAWRDTVNAVDRSIKVTSFVALDTTEFTSLKCAALNVNGGNVTNAVLTSTAGGNTVNLLNLQGGAGAITGNGAAQTLYSYTIPGGAMGVGRGIRVTFWVSHGVGVANVTYALSYGGVSNNIATTAAAGSCMGTFLLFNNAGVTNAQQLPFVGMLNNNVVVGGPGVFTGYTRDSTVNQTLTLTFSVANTDTVTPQFWIAEVIQ